MGFLYLQIKDYQKAIEILTKLQTTDPQYTSLYTYLAAAQEAQNQLEDALTTVQTGIGYDAYNEVLYQKGSDLALQLGNNEVAEQMLHDLILFFQEMAQVPEMLAALKQYLKLVPNDLEMQTLYDDYQAMQ